MSLALAACPAYAQQDKDSDAGYIFYKANTLYEKGSYDEAISEYSRLLAQGMESGNLYFNLGNCYFKKGEMGKALVHYERARRLMPRDSDLKSNIKFVQSQITSNSSETPLTWTEKAAGIFGYLSLNELTLLLSAALAGMFIFLTIRLFVLMRKGSFILGIAVFIVTLTFISISLINRIALTDMEGIVITDRPDALFEPLERATVHFSLHEGTKVHILQTKEEWIKIKRSDNKTGWVTKESVEKL